MMKSKLLTGAAVLLATAATQPAQAHDGHVHDLTTEQQKQFDADLDVPHCDLNVKNSGGNALWGCNVDVHFIQGLESDTRGTAVSRGAEADRAHDNNSKQTTQTWSHS